MDRNDFEPRICQEFSPHSRRASTMVRPGVYSRHALSQGVRALRHSDGKAVVAKMKEMPTDDKLFSRHRVRAEGRRSIRVLFEVKTPANRRDPGRLQMSAPTIPAGPSARWPTGVARPFVKTDHRTVAQAGERILPFSGQRGSVMFECSVHQLAGLFWQLLSGSSTPRSTRCFTSGRRSIFVMLNTSSLHPHGAPVHAWRLHGAFFRLQ